MMSLAKHQARIFGFAVRIAVLIWAFFILLVGTSTAIDPGAADSEPEAHSPSERFWGVAYVALSLSWILSPQLARRGFRKPVVAILLVFPVMFMVALTALRLLDPVTYGSAWWLFFVVGLFVTLPGVLTVAEIYANPNPLRVLALIRWWRDSRLDILNLR